MREIATETAHKVYKQRNKGKPEEDNMEVAVQEISFSRLMDRASSQLLAHFINRTNFKSAALIKRKQAGGKAAGEPYLRFDFRRVLITKSRLVERRPDQGRLRLLLPGDHHALPPAIAGRARWARSSRASGAWSRTTRRTGFDRERDPRDGDAVTTWRSWSWTDPGTVRSGNEDAFVDRSDALLWAVADGAGGHQHGEVASAALKATLEETAGATGADLVADVRIRVATVHDGLRARAEQEAAETGLASPSHPPWWSCSAMGSTMPACGAGTAAPTCSAPGC